MSYDTRGLLEDKQTKPIPQVNDDLTDEYQPANGDGAAISVAHGKWYQVGSGATTTTLPMASYGGLTLTLSSSIQSELVGATLTIKDDTALVVAKVTAVSTAGVLTIDATLSAAPAQGAYFMLTPPEQTQLSGRNVTSQPADLQGMVNVTAGQSKNFVSQCLNNLARDRIIGFQNTADQDATVTVFPYVATVGDSYLNISYQVTVKSKGSAFVSNGQLNEIGAPFDSLNIAVNYATLPTNGGAINTTVVETIGN